MPGSLETIADEIKRIYKLIVKLGFNQLNIVDVGSGRNALDKIKELQSLLAEQINLCVCWSPSVNVMKSNEEASFLHEI